MPYGSVYILCCGGEQFGGEKVWNRRLLSDRDQYDTANTH